MPEEADALRWKPFLRLLRFLLVFTTAAEVQRGAPQDPGDPMPADMRQRVRRGGGWAPPWRTFLARRRRAEEPKGPPAARCFARTPRPFRHGGSGSLPLTTP